VARSPPHLQVTPSHPPMVGRRLDVNATEWPAVDQVRVRVWVRVRVRVRVGEMVRARVRVRVRVRFGVRGKLMVRLHGNAT